MNRACPFLLLYALILGSCDRLPGKPTAADVALEPDQVRDFALLYQQNCAGCHGQDGKGSSALALANPVYLAIASDDVLGRVTSQGVPGTLMPAFAKSDGGTLTDTQIDLLVRGMRTRWSNPELLQGAPPPPYADRTPGDAQRGGQVYATFCISCHGPHGRGTDKSGSIVDPSFLALVSNQSLRSTIIAGRPDLGHPDWRNCLPGRAVTAREVSDVVAWLAAQRSTTPGQPYAQLK